MAPRSAHITTTLPRRLAEAIGSVHDDRQSKVRRDRAAKRIRTYPNVRRDAEKFGPANGRQRISKRRCREDDEIQALERKLGMKPKGKKRKLPKEFDDDGLGELLEDLDSDSESEEEPTRSDEAAQEPSKGQRENPYRPPVTDTIYIPPALRKAADTQDAQLCRQLKGLLNRLTDENVTFIFSEIQSIYRTNARQLVTECFLGLLVDHISQSSLLRKESLADHAGLIALAYRDISIEVGAQTVERVVDAIEERYNGDQDLSSLTNLMGFLAELCTLQVVGNQLLFDYVRLLVEEANEVNVKLLLRVVEVAGPLLRASSPSALRDIHKLLASQESIGSSTKYIIDMLGKLKDGSKRHDTAAAHASKVKRTVNQLSTSKSSLDSLNISLKELRQREVRGRWWLVGASFKTTTNQEAPKAEVDTVNALATALRMNTSVRKSIFAALISATDASDAQNRLSCLRLSRTQTAEIPAVLLHCCAKEAQFNLYYALLARRFCNERGRKSRVGMERAIWDFVGRLETGGEPLSELVNVGKLVGRLISWRALDLDLFRRLEWPVEGQVDMWVEVVLIDALTDENFEPNGLKDRPDLAINISYLVKKLRHSDLVVNQAGWKGRCRKFVTKLDKMATDQSE